MTPTRMSAAIAAVAAVAACQDPVQHRAASSRDPGATRSAPPGAPSDAAAPGTAGSPDTQRGPPQVVAMSEPPIALPSQESFQLLSPGKGARAPLRYALAAGTTAMMARSALKSRHLEGSAFSRPAGLPAIRDGFELAIAGEHPERIALHAVIGASAA
ncbi:MAG TPA: hypothetical protein VK601_29790, partial [Kofleriaceae bacterium]|nr:hypothetical protein [Kofleriaceae bacterium]